MAGIKFRRDSNEVSCDGTVWVKRTGGQPFEAACFRRAGHKGECIAMACDAAAADGVCFECREPIDQPHRRDCIRAQNLGLPRGQR